MAYKVFNDTIDMLLKLKMIGDHAGGWVQVLEPIDAPEFARRLEVLGFPGDPAEIAGEVSRCRGGPGVSVEHICSALFGIKQFRRAGQGTAKDAAKTKSASARKKNPIRKAEWDSSIFSGYCTNASRPSSLRVYFSTPPKDPVLHRAASNPSLTRPQAKGAKGSPQVRRGRSASPLSERLPRRVRPGELHHRA
ncbi:unnamed protein product [Symbiodinium pilosum]|uniref:Uncharacterized protein n=1 Tax=Symbiodinium pilosum TaxID=2952 RepID=A0A812YCC1_SYMPI|nr:unnamed protein product [Symbiodinium pilosum]